MKIVKRREISIIIVSLLVAFVFQMMEYLLNRQGIELRTGPQMIKGILVWLVIPAVVFYQCGKIFWQKVDSPVGRILFVVVISIGILAAGFNRGLIYTFSGEMVEETMTEDGYICGTQRNGLAGGSWDTYYVNLNGIFRAPFSGWSKEETTAMLQERYGADVTPVDREEDTFLYYASADELENTLFYFEAENDYLVNNNFLYQKMKCDIEAFWEMESRASYYYDEDQDRYDIVGGEWTDTKTYPKAKHSLAVECYSKSDLQQCAIDITNWMTYALMDDRYCVENGSVASELARIRIRYQDQGFWIELYEFTNWQQEYTWAEICQKVVEEIEQSAINGDIEWNVPVQVEVSTEENQKTKTSEEEQEAQFMKYYTGDYEKECEVGDGTLRYRMVVMDAALGSRLYTLLKSEDSGVTWEVANLDPFQEQMGMDIDFTFLNENLGFATLDHNGGDEADLYITEDGGETYEEVVIEEVMVSLEDGYHYAPYDYPQMPYEENGKMYLLCGQGLDGDYDGGDDAGRALFVSEDGGHTFAYQQD